MSVSIITCFADICNTRFVQRQFRNEICMRAVYRCGKASMRVYHCAQRNIAVRCASLQRTRLFCRNFVQCAVSPTPRKKLTRANALAAAAMVAVSYAPAPREKHTISPEWDKASLPVSPAPARAKIYLLQNVHTTDICDTIQASDLCL